MGNGLMVQVQSSSYSEDLAKPTNGDDIRAIEDDATRINVAKQEALRYRQELFALVTADQRKKEGKEADPHNKAGKEGKEEKEGPMTLFYGGGPTINDLILDVDEETAFENCVKYVSHVRQLLHLQVQRRRRLSRRGKKLLVKTLSFEMVDDSSDESDLEDLDKKR